ncbi:MAG: type II secretion system F family protein [Patescibacteria group bacterium]
MNNIFLKQPEKLFLRLSLRDKILFFKQLSILMRAGIPLFSSLKMLKDQARSSSMAKIVKQVILDVENGQYLATAIGKFRKVFGDLAVNIIAVGEISGTLSDNLDHLAAALKKQQSLRQKIISASVYPVFIFIATLLITIMLTVFFFPKVIPVLKSINYQLPWTTRFLIFISDSLKNHGLSIGLSVITLIILVFFLLKIKKIHFWYDKTLLYVPIIKKLMQAYNIANMTRTLGLLLNSGVGIVKGFHIASDTTANLVYRKELIKIADEILKGEKIFSHMKKRPELFPAMMTQMIMVGENSGKLSETFLYICHIYEEEMDNMTKNLSTAVEPLLLILMGILVGFIAVSIITPIYGITQHLKPY